MAVFTPQLSPPGNVAPFFRSELVTIQVSGTAPLTRFSLVMGTPVPPIFDPVPGTVTGSLEVGPDIMPVPGFDGLGIFGSFDPFARTDASGALTLTFQVPASCAFTQLDALKNVQAAVAQVPDPTMPNPAPIILSTAAPLQVADPGGSLAISDFSTNGANPKSFVEGTPTQVTIAGSFVRPTTAFPVVTFESLLDPAPLPVTANVVSIDATAGTIVVDAPATLPPSAGPPVGAFGPVRVTVDYVSAGVSCDLIGGAVTAGVTASCDTPIPMLPPTYLLYESTLFPTVTALSTRGTGTNTTGPVVTITGTDFMLGAEVIFQQQGTLQRTLVSGPAVTVVDATTIMVQAPTLAARGVYDVLVRNPDCHESTPSAALSEFVYFDLQSIAVGAVFVNGGMPTLIEGAGTFTLRVDGTAQTETGDSGVTYHPLDGMFGMTTVDLGSDLGPMAFTTVATTAPMVGVMGVPGMFRFDMLTASATPPGLVFPPALTMNGRTNTGPKHVRLTASANINPGQLPHQTFAALSNPTTTPEPMNLLLFTAANAPAITTLAPNNCIRASGGQTLSVIGTDVLTNDAVLPSSVSGLGPRIELFDPLATIPTTTVPLDTIDIAGATVTVTLTTPDLSTFGVSLPYALGLRLTNPDGQSVVAAASVFLQESLVSANAADENLLPTMMSSTVNSTVALPGGAPIIYNHIVTDDLVIPAGVTLSAQGEHPLIVRVRGDVTLSGTLDLSGGSVTGAPFFRPSGAGVGGAGETPATFGSALALSGRPGTSVVDAATSDMMMALTLHALGEGLGGTHNVGGSGGGGGASLNVGMDGVDGPGGAPVPGAGGNGGMAFVFPMAGVLPVPPLTPAGMMPGAASFTEIWNPPGGAGGGAGGMGTVLPFLPAAPPLANEVGLNGAGGNGGGGLAILCDGVITITGSGRILTTGQDGGPGQANMLVAPNDFGGGGGGGGAGGGVLLQAIQGIVVEATMGNPDSLNLLGGAGGLGAAGPSNAGTDGGAGSDGVVRFALPINTAVLMGGALNIDPMATINGTQDLTGF